MTAEIDNSLWVLTVLTSDGITVHVEGAKPVLEELLAAMPDDFGPADGVHPHLTQVPFGWTCDMPNHRTFRRSSIA